MYPKPKTYEGFPHQAIDVKTERCLLPFPHYSDDRFRHEQLLYLNPDTELSAISWDYGDRFRSWDSEKTKKIGGDRLCSQISNRAVVRGFY